MSKFLKVLAGLGVAAAATGVAISLSKKKEENDDTQDDFDVCDNCESQDCDNCNCSNCDEGDVSECNSDSAYDEGDEFVQALKGTYGFDDELKIDIKKTIDSAINGALHSLMNASIEVGSFCSKIAEAAAHKLTKRKYPSFYEDSKQSDDFYEQEPDSEAEYYKHFYNTGYSGNNFNSETEDYDFSIIADPNVYYGQHEHQSATNEECQHSDDESDK